MGTSSSQGNIKKYRLSQGMGFSPGLSCVPCGVCPVSCMINKDNYDICLYSLLGLFLQGIIILYFVILLASL